jgi:hypothetical protein
MPCDLRQQRWVPRSAHAGPTYLETVRAPVSLVSSVLCALRGHVEVPGHADFVVEIHQHSSAGWTRVATLDSPALADCSNYALSGDGHLFARTRLLVNGETRIETFVAPAWNLRYSFVAGALRLY